MKRIIAAALLLSTGTFSVSAADLIIEQPGMVTVADDVAHDWSGGYVGIVGGYGVGEATSTDLLNGDVDNIPAAGWLLGVNAGFNHQMESFVLGLEGEALWSTVTGSEACEDAPASVCAGSLNWLGSLRARAGVAVDSLLLYGTLGVAAGGVNATVTPPVGASTGTFSGTALGWTAGVGAEFAVTENVSVKGEYAYYALGPLQAPVGTLSPVGADDLRANIHTAKVGVNFSF